MTSKKEDIYKITKESLHQLIADKILGDLGAAITVAGIEDDGDATYYRIVTK